MDPNECLKEALQIASSSDGRLPELLVSLDEWLTKGGFLPSRWTRRECRSCTDYMVFGESNLCSSCLNSGVWVVCDDYVLGPFDSAELASSALSGSVCLLNHEIVGNRSGA